MVMNRVVKTTIKISVFAVVLLVLIVAGGIGYIWYTGQNNSDEIASSDTTVKASKPTTVIAPVKTAENAKVGASIQELTSPVLPGDNSSITVKTNPDAKCTISVIYDKTPSTDSGLLPKVADEYGIASWTWTVEKSAPLGKWPVKVTCAKGKMSGVVIGDLKLVKQLE